MSLQPPSLYDSRVRRAASLLAAAGVALATFACTPAGDAQEAADLVLRGGRVVTVDPAVPEAEAVAIRGDRIVFVGSDSEAAAFTGRDTEVIDLAGRLAIPGFIEGHGHLMGLGHSRLQLDLMATSSYQDLIDRVAEAVAASEPGDWIVGRGWHQSKWDPAPEPSVRSSTRCLPTTRYCSGTHPDTPASRTRWRCSSQGSTRPRRIPPGARSSATRPANLPAFSWKRPPLWCRSPMRLLGRP